MLSFFSRFGFSFTYPCPRKLREIVKLSLIEKEPKDKIIELWLKYHSKKSESIAYALTKAEFQNFI